MKLRVYENKSTKLFYVINASVPLARADCFSIGFATRKEARIYANKLLRECEKLQSKCDFEVSLYGVNKLPIFFPENGRATEKIEPWEFGTTELAAWQLINNK